MKKVSNPPDFTSMSYPDRCRSPRWLQSRIPVILRDDFYCQYCGESEIELNVHHLDYDPSRLPWKSPEDNLVTLCKHCHKATTFLQPPVTEFINSIQEPWRSLQIHAWVAFLYTLLPPAILETEDANIGTPGTVNGRLAEIDHSPPCNIGADWFSTKNKRTETGQNHNAPDRQRSDEL